MAGATNHRWAVCGRSVHLDIPLGTWRSGPEDIAACVEMLTGHRLVRCRPWNRRSLSHTIRECAGSWDALNALVPAYESGTTAYFVARDVDQIIAAWALRCEVCARVIHDPDGANEGKVRTWTARAVRRAPFGGAFQLAAVRYQYGGQEICSWPCYLADLARAWKQWTTATEWRQARQLERRLRRVVRAIQRDGRSATAVRVEDGEL